MNDAVPSSADAIGARRAQIKAADRPERLNEGFSIKDAVTSVRETVDIVKLYHREWITVFTSEARGDEGMAECTAFFAKKYEGRVYEDDVVYESAVEGLPAGDKDQWPYRLRLKLPNVSGEFKRVDLAEAERDARGWSPDDCQIVPRNSRADYALREYGTKKLVSTTR